MTEDQGKGETLVEITGKKKKIDGFKERRSRSRDRREKRDRSRSYDRRRED